MDLKLLVGSGDRIGQVVAPVAVIGLIANLLAPSVFGVGGPPEPFRILSLVILAIGVVVWLWSAALILLKVPRHELITTGPFAVVRHPLYTGVALLVLPWLGFVFDTWLGFLVGLVLYAASRFYSPREEADLARMFGPRWRTYSEGVLIPWL